MISENVYLEKIKDYSYPELLEEEIRLFRRIIDLQYKIVLQETRLEYDIINPSYKVQLLSNRKYLIALQKLIADKEELFQEEELKQRIKDAFERQDEKN